MILNNKKSQARAGSYMCESSNSVGKGRSKEITLDIKCKKMVIMVKMIMVMVTMIDDGEDHGDDDHDNKQQQ